MENQKLISMLESIHYPAGKITKEYLFTLDAVDVYFYNNNIGQSDIKTQFVDGKNDGGIDYIYADDETLYLIQGKSTNNLTVEDVNNAFNKIHATVLKMKDRRYDDLSDAVKSAFMIAYDDLSDDKNIELVLFTNTEFSEKEKTKIQKLGSQENLNNYSLNVYDKNDIDLRKAVINQDSSLIKEGVVFIDLGDDKSANKLFFEDGKGLIVNVKASSVKNLYTKFKDQGLFSYNLREHIKQKSVDKAIAETIKKDRKNFWYYNNGITIGCTDYSIDGNRIRLYGFSIINGAQTTTIIGESNEINERFDFSLTCKIVKADDSIDQEEDFISRISEASNSQKPIKFRDLKANAKEQKLLQDRAANNGKHSLAIEIKRGVRPKNYKSVEKWQRVSNDYVGQLIYSCILQYPGVARRYKTTMFSSTSIYNDIFIRTHDYDTLFDLVRLGDVYNDYLSKLASSDEDIEKISVAKNAKFTTLGIMCYLLKKRRDLIIDRNSSGLHEDNISGLLVSNYPYDDLDKKVVDLFGFIIRQIKSVYKENESTLKLTSYSNFLKSDNYYEEIILKHFDDLDDYDMEKIGGFMTVFDGQ